MYNIQEETQYHEEKISDKVQELSQQVHHQQGDVLPE